MKFVTPDEMAEIEERSAALGVSRLLLMENAGNAVAEYVQRKFAGKKALKTVIVAGTGNNGGDGFVAARHLAGFEFDVTVILLGTKDHLRTVEAKTNWEVLERMPQSIRLFTAPSLKELTGMGGRVKEAEIIIDSIFGTGIKGRIRDPHSMAIDLINQSRAFRVAVDVPSGLDPVTGEVHDKAVSAEATVTFHRMKHGLLKRRDLVGEVVVAGIGVPPEADRATPSPL